MANFKHKLMMSIARTTVHPTAIRNNNGQLDCGPFLVVYKHAWLLPTSIPQPLSLHCRSEHIDFMLNPCGDLRNIIAPGSDIDPHSILHQPSGSEKEHSDEVWLCMFKRCNLFSTFSASSLSGPTASSS